VLTQIARFCCGNTLIALSRLSREYAFKHVEDNEPVLRIKAYQDDYVIPKLRRSALWRAAKEWQFPDAVDLPFLDDDVSYFIAKARKLAVIFIYEEEVGSIVEYNRTMNDIMSNVGNWATTHVIPLMLKFQIKYRFLTINLDNEIRFFKTQDDIERAIARYGYEHEIKELMVFDLKYINKRFSNHAKQRYKSYNDNPVYWRMYRNIIPEDDGKPITYYGRKLGDSDEYYIDDDNVSRYREG
jgi:hypothetical protein